MLVLAPLLVLALVIGGILRIAHPHPVGRFAKVVAQIAIAGAGEVEDSQTIGLLWGQVVHQMEAVAGEQAQGEVALLIVERRGQVPPQAEPIGHQEGIAGVGVVQVAVSLFEVGCQARVGGVEGQRPLVQEGVLLQGVEEMPPVPAGGLGGDLEGVEGAGCHLRGELLDEGLGAGAVVVHGEARSPLLALPVHQTHGVGFAVDVNAHQERVRHHAPPYRCRLPKGGRIPGSRWGQQPRGQ